jgi:hypothetical protein
MESREATALPVHFSAALWPRQAAFPFARKAPVKKPTRRVRPASYYLSRGFQRRMLVVVLLMIGLLLVVQWIRRPQAITWLMQGGLDPHANQRIDNRLRPQPQRPEIPGTFVARAEVPDSDGSDGLFPGVNPGYLADVRDDSPYRSAEGKAFFQILHLLQQADDAQLADATPVTYLQLYEQPKAYRGELVTVRGYVRAAWPQEAPGIPFSNAHGIIGGLTTITGMACTPGNEYGIKGYTEIWLQPRERLSEVMMLYTLDLPEGFPTGDSLKEEVTATGVFFKRIAYGAQGTYRTTPLVLTKTLQRELPPPPPADPKNDLPLFLTAAAVMLGLCIVVVVYVYRNSGSTTKDTPEYLQRILDRNKDIKDPDFTGIEVPDEDAAADDGGTR